MTTITTHDEAMAFINDRSGYDRGFISNPFAGDEAARLGLVRTSRLLEGLGNPQHDYPIVHIAGSKGKGSTATFVDSISQACGWKAGRFLSPHMHAFNERFVVSNQPIPDDAFTAIVAEAAAATLQVEEGDPTVGRLTAWELSTAIALLWFSRSGCAVATVEVGMGGTLDATNVIAPAVTVITRLDFEHTAILGDTLAEIASNKAGIIKPGIPMLTVEQPAEATTVIADRAAELSSPLLIANRDWTTSGTSDSFDWISGSIRIDELASALIGDHQVENAGLAIAAVRELVDRVTLSPSLTTDAIRKGLASAFIPGRFEIVDRPGTPLVVIDGAHSPESTRAVARTIHDRYPNAHVTTIVGMLSDKDPALVLPPLDAITSEWIVAPLNSPRSTTADDLRDSLGARGISVATAPSVASALGTSLASTRNGGEDLILVVGSLTTASEARVALGLA
jgi:dihydrofolate synthase/folylpolyglutamate synthase